MRAVAVFVVVGAAVTAAAALPAGSAVASHRAGRGGALSAVSPSWSPDGKQVAFAYLPSSRRYRIVRTSSRPGGAVHTVLAAGGHCCEQLQWAADGRILVNPNSRVKSVAVRGGKARRLLFSSCPNSYGCQTLGFILSPNRQYAAVAITTDYSDPHSAWGIALVKLRRGREPAVLPALITEGTDAALAFSPDGRELVFSQASWDGWDEGPHALMAIPVDGGGPPVPLAQSGIPGASLVPSDVEQLQWSPDGRWVAYVEQSPYGIQDLAVVPTTGGTPRSLATCDGNSDFRFSWSPTSKLLAYTHHCQTAASRGTSTQFMTAGPNGTHRTDLLKRGRFADVQGTPQWSPDGSRLLFVAPRLFPGGTGKISYVWTIRPNGRGLTRLG